MKKKRANVTKRDPEKTKNAILEQAALCFAQNGFHGTGLNDICKKAKANKRMIYHYFGNKDALYRAVHLKGWQELGAWFSQELTQSSNNGTDLSDASRLLLEAVRIFHDFVATRQLFVRLLMWDGLEGGHVSRTLWQDVRGPIYRQLETLVVGTQESGFLSKALKPGHLIISFMGAISFYFSHAHTMVDIFRDNPLSPGMVEERKEQISLLLRKLMGSSLGE